MSMLFDVVLLAAGESRRMGADKLFLPIGQDIVLSRAVSAFYNHPAVNNIVLVYREDTLDLIFSVIRALDKSRFRFVTGGAARTESVEKGLSACKAEGVLIHDAARPFLSRSLIDAVIHSVVKSGTGVPALPLSDSVRTVKNGVIDGALDRSMLYTVQTPQGFLTAKIKKAYALRDGNYTDDSDLYSQKIGPVHIVKGDERNIKITTSGTYFGLNSNIGIGYDIHCLVPGRKLILCGIELQSDRGSLAHSDGDAGIHALIDALLSAINERDIGTMFPDTDPRYDGIDSTILLSKVMELYRAYHRGINNVSIILKLDEPKIRDDIPVMKIKLANLLGIDASCISISGKTTENTSPDTIEAYACVIVN